MKLEWYQWAALILLPVLIIALVIIRKKRGDQ